MAYTRERFTESGARFYEITVSRGRGLPRISRRWYPPAGWSARAIERQLAKEAAALEAAVDAGKATTKREAREAAARDQQAALRALTVKEYAETVFLPRWEVSRASTTMRAYVQRLNIAIFPALGALRVSAVRPVDISDLLAKLQKDGYAAATASAVRVTLAALFSSAVEDGIIPASPVKAVKRPKRRKDELKQAAPVHLSADEVARVLRQLPNETPMHAAFVRLLIETGVREGEALALCGSDIQPSGAISITDNAQYTPARGRYIDTPKGKAARTVYASPETAAALLSLSAAHGGGYCFSVDGKTPLHAATMRQYIRRLALRLGLPHLHAHALRHTFATAAIKAGVDVASVAAALGHSSPAITLRTYAHADTTDARRAAEAVRASLIPGDQRGEK